MKKTQSFTSSAPPGALSSTEGAALWSFLGAVHLFAKRSKGHAVSAWWSFNWITSCI